LDGLKGLMDEWMVTERETGWMDEGMDGWDRWIDG